MKKFISILLCILMLVPFIGMTNAFAASDTINSLVFNVYAGEKGSIDSVKAVKKGNDFFMYIPGNSSCTETKLYFNASSDVYIDDVNVGLETIVDVSGEGITTHKLVCDGVESTLYMIHSSKIPSIHITTESGSLNYIHSNKENKEAGNIRIYDEKSKVTTDANLSSIKGRGNSTWGQPKKPYNIKFDKKTSILGMPKAKKWTLLANHFDPSNIRNIVAYELAERIGLPYSSLYKSVDLYINNEYLGNYLICESVEVGDNRVEINDLKKANENANPGVDIESLATNSSGGELPGSKKWVEIPNNPDNITGGYLLEFDYQNRYNAEVSGFETNRGQNVTIKEPEYASKEEVEYISAYYQEAEDALVSDTGYNSLGKHFTEYFDMETLTKMYILEELSLDVDAGQTSFYLTKDADDPKFYVAPAWDFDSGFGSKRVCSTKLGIDMANYNAWYANQNYYSRHDDYKWTQSEIECFFTLAYEYQPEIRKAVKEQWNEFKNVFNDEFLSFVEAEALKITDSSIMNDIRWNRANVSNAKDVYAKNVKEVTDFLVNRRGFLEKGFAENSANVYYNSNGARGKVLDYNLHYIGEEITVLDYNSNPNYALENNIPYVFKHWNTKPDDSGISYKAGDKITITSDEVHLYAIWTNPFDIVNPDPDEPGDNVNFFQKIINFFKKIFDWFAKIFS